MRKMLQFIRTGLLVLVGASNAHAQTKEIQLPEGVGAFFTTVLTNGNIALRCNFNEPGKGNVGAVLLYDGKTQELISILKGSTEGDGLGSAIYALPNGNFVLASGFWNDGATPDAGAVTLINGTTGLNGIISTSNSLTGTLAYDRIGISGITVLPNGNYLVRSYAWHTTGKSFQGAVTWCDGNAGLIGKVSAANSLVGGSNNDEVGQETILVLQNSNYVVGTSKWDNGAVANVGAVTWCNGSTGRTGMINPGNSLIGSSAGDVIATPYGPDTPRLVALTNGNYVVASPYWDNGSLDSAGAVTWCSGIVETVGVVSAANSLVGGSAKDQVGAYQPVALTNGNYVVSSPAWKNGNAENAGAVTWGNGATGTVGLVSLANSLVGTDGTDYVGGIQPVYWPIFSLESNGPRNTVVALSNGNYVVVSRNWNRDGLKWAGAVTWGNGATGTIGPVTADNSLVGTVAMDRVGHLGVEALTNGHYVVASPLWNNGAKLKIGAVTWCDGTTGRVGEITESNSFVGVNENDNVGSNYITALTNGNYVIKTRLNTLSGLEDAGMATWADGSGELTGSPTAVNSLFGTHPSDFVGNYVTPLVNGNYLVRSDYWNGTAQYTGAITVGNGATGTSGAVSISNSLVGTYNGDRLGIHSVYPTPDGNFFVENSAWQKNTGAVLWGNGASETAGQVNDCNSVLGSASAVYNNVYKYLITRSQTGYRMVLYYPNGAPFLSKNADTGSATLNPSHAASLMGGTGCRIIATVESQGASPVTGNISAKAWLETGVPAFGGDPFVARHYEITPEQNAATSTGRVTLYFSQDDFDAFNAAPGSTLDLPVNADDAAGKSNLRIGKYSGTSSDGTGLPRSYTSILSTIIDPADSDIAWNHMFKRWEVTFDTQGFSGFVVQTSPVSLPVRLVSFQAKVEGKAVKLDWQTADAVNFSRFEIERAPDAKRFQYFAKIDYEEGTERYAVTDDEPRTNIDGQIYYRLKMLDHDGTYAYSNIAYLQMDKSNVAYVYPNPVADHLTISLPGYDGLTGTLKLVDATGNVLINQSFTVLKDKAGMDLKQARLTEGIYTIQVEIGGEQRQFKIVRAH